MILLTDKYSLTRGRLTFLAIALCVCLLAEKGLAFVNEAISLALEAATPYVEEGFEVRSNRTR